MSTLTQWFAHPSRLVAASCAVLALNACTNGQAGTNNGTGKDSTGPTLIKDTAVVNAPAADVPFDAAIYNQKLVALANGDSSGKWPVKAPLPIPGAIIPFKRIVAYYGNLYSKNMGVLGEYPPDEMLKMLQGECKKWETADPGMPVVPALHYIAVTAQGAPGKDGKYRLRMPFKQIDSILGMAKKINALVFIDVQVGFSNVQAEIPLLEQYLKMPNVHLGIDPEFSMKTGKRPGSVIGTMDASDVNFVSNYLAGLAKANNLPPKILVVHRFTQNMVTNYKNITTRPEVQIVMDMDGWGEPSLKHDSYKAYVWREPVQYAGFKLFYKNDIKKKDSHMLTPEEVLALTPKPVYIQYQ